MDEGIGLYQQGRYLEAITKFEKAYELELKASPLINIALSYKALDEKDPPYPAAIPRTIEALKTAVTQHADTLDPGVKESAEAEIKTLQAALRYLTIAIEPAEAARGAEVLINGVPQPPDELERIPLRARTWTVEAQADGYQSLRREVKLISERHSTVKLALVPTTGELSIEPTDKASRVEIHSDKLDFEGRGDWQQRVPPGVYEVRIYKPGKDEAEPYTLEVAVTQGQSTEVTQLEDGRLYSEAALSASESPDREGLYFLGSGALLLLPKSIAPSEFEVTGGRLQMGPALNLRAGYRVAHWVGFEGSVQYNVIYSELDATLRIGEGDTERVVDGVGADYQLHCLRFGGLMRFWYPGPHWVRFVGSAGGGLAYANMVWDHFAQPGAVEGADLNDPALVHALQPYNDASGVNFFVQVDAGVEFELDKVLFGAMLQVTLQPSRGLRAEGASESAFGNELLVFVGPAIHVGYGLW